MNHESLITRRSLALAALAGLGILGLAIAGIGDAEMSDGISAGDTSTPRPARVDGRAGAEDSSRRILSEERFERRGYDFELVATTETKLDLRLSPEDTTPVRGAVNEDSVRGRLDLNVYGSFCGGRLLGVSFTRARISDGADREHGLPAAEILIRVAANGRFDRIAFPDSIDAETRHTLIAVCQLFQRVEPESGAASSWTAVEPCFVGRIAARYTATDTETGANLRREVDRVVELTTVGDGDVDLVVRDVRGGRDIRLDPVRRVLSSRGDQCFGIGSPKNGLSIRRSVATRMKLVDVTPLDSDAAEDARERMASASAIAFASPSTAQAAMAARVIRFERESIRGRDVDSLLAVIGELEDFDPQKNPDAFAARMLLPVLLAHDPTALARVAALLDGEFGPVVKTLLTALGEAGTPAAQDLLSAVLSDSGRGAEMRFAAIMSFTQTATPTAESARALAGVLVDRDSPEVAQSALFMLGGVIGRLGSDSARDESLRALESAVADRDGDPRWRNAYLVALGNVGHPSVLPRIEKHLGSEDVAVRQGAVRALRRFDSHRARGKVLEILKKDPSPLVRIEAIEIAARGSDRDSFKAVADSLRSDKSATVRVRALEFMASRMGSDARARSLVENAMRRDSDQGIRREAARLLSTNTTSQRVGG